MAVEFRGGRKRVLVHARTHGEGDYDVRIPLPPRSRGRVEAFYAGDDTHARADSGPRPVPVAQ